jgi:YVTN family beta-propeller protein
MAALVFTVTPSLASATSSAFVYVTDDSTPLQQFGASGSGALSPLSVSVTPGHGRGIAVSPDGKNVYTAGGVSVAQYAVTADGTLSALSPATVPALNQEGGTAEVGSIVVSPDGRSVYAATVPNGVGGGSVVQFDRAQDGTLTAKTPSAVFIGEGQTLAITPDGQYLYATSDDHDIEQLTVNAFDGTLAPNGHVSATGYTVGLAVSPDSKTLWATNVDGDTVSQWTIGSTGTLTAKSTATVATGQAPFGVAVSPDGKNVYIANSGDQTLSQYDVAGDGSLSPKSAATVPVGSTPLGVAVSADGASVYVANKGSSSISQLDVGSDGSLTAKSPAAVASGTYPRNIGLQPPPPGADTTAPDTRIAGGPLDGGKTNDNTPTLTFESSEPSSTFTCKIDGGQSFTCTSPYTTSVLGDGSHTFAVAATDAANNTDASPAQHTFTVDTVAPDTSITAGPADGSSISTFAPTFSFTSTEPGSSFLCKIDGGLALPCTSPALLALSVGPHTFSVEAIDQAGNVDATPATRSFTVALPTTLIMVPGAPGTPSALPGDGQAMVSWTAPSSDGGAPITSYTVTASPGGQTCSWTSGPLHCAVTGLSNGTAYTFTVTAANSAGAGLASVPSAAVTPAAAPPSAAQIKAFLKQQLVSSGKRARISALLKHGNVALTMTLPVAGNVAIGWYLVPPGAHLAKAKPAPILVASGKATFPASASKTVTLKLTSRGRRLLKHAKSLKLTARGTFSPPGQQPVTALTPFTLKR